MLNDDFFDDVFCPPAMQAKLHFISALLWSFKLKKLVVKKVNAATMTRHLFRHTVRIRCDVAMLRSFTIENGRKVCVSGIQALIDRMQDNNADQSGERQTDERRG